ncbi:flavodoxin family protein [Jiangella sp. DSM 45060]|uniref:flavodoxin family protein n=1 Tax=Jiangella sp. DSM 45060 TaxID=1798224 RepID=UPI00087A4F17|nr:NAD(P)H-dependent oxidoreductase [Jiangella sp. DSM 45060]SDT45510.1 Multimeric flavodoxin WrbA [Jiangella sp. DSM 45060]
MKAVVLNCTLKPSPQPSNTGALADVVAGFLGEDGVEVTAFRLADLKVPPGVQTDLGDGDDWPRVHDAILAAEILVVASPTWVGRPSSLAQRAVERMDAMISETADDGRPVAFDKVAGVVVTGNEDGAHHVISELCGAMMDIGFTIPAQAWTYWHLGPGPGPDYLDETKGHDWAHTTGRTMAANLVATASALAASPLPSPA